MNEFVSKDNRKTKYPTKQFSCSVFLSKFIYRIGYSCSSFEMNNSLCQIETVWLGIVVIFQKYMYHISKFKLVLRNTMQLDSQSKLHNTKKCDVICENSAYRGANGVFLD